MTTVSSGELAEIARKLAKERFDDYAARGLARAYEEFVGRRHRPVASIDLTIDGKPYPSLYAALADPSARFASGELRLEKPPAPGPAWEFLEPWERLVFHDDGSADLFPSGDRPPRHAVARVLLREHYFVRSRQDDTPGAPRAQLPGLGGTLEQGLGICRALSVLPFGVAILLSFAEARERFEVDAVHSSLLADPRAGRLAAARRVARPSRIAWGLDRKLARGHLSLLAARSLEVLVESNGMTAIEMAHVFGGVRELVDSALQALVQQRYATLDPRTGVYRARLEAFLPPAEEPATPASAPRHPELRTSVQELQDAADARAACPLCGRPLPSGSAQILCDLCLAEVGLG